MKEPTGTTNSREQEAVAVTIGQWTHDVDHDMRKSLLRDLKLAHINQFSCWLHLLACVAHFTKFLNIRLDGGPVVVFSDPLGGWPNPYVVQAVK